ncbi:AAA family ATPase [Salinicola halophyticus]|uniref:AAA family ATPase n=1 Tax=Salinicola halophyticus TaxID=1808881 RepID=UPI000DA1406A|nr:AAA family ATPase [Salinicola halophyticus]
MLIILGGLPGVGKTTVARRAAESLFATHLRIDTIEQAVWDANVSPNDDLKPVGYMVASRLATDNLRLGRIVIGDAVNSIEETRQAWRRAADLANVEFVQIELFCSDEATHRNRIASRESDIENLELPDWAKVKARHYEPWKNVDLIIDTSQSDIETASRQIIDLVNIRLGRHTV